MVANPFNFASDAVLRHVALPNQLSASSSRIPAATFPPLQANSNDVLRHTAMLNQLSASSSRIPAATFPPLQANLNDVINFPIRRAGALNQTSAFNSGIHAPAFAPLQDNSTLELSLGQPRSVQMAPQELMQYPVSPQELMQNNHGTPAVRVLSLCHPGSEQFTPQMLMQNGEVLPTVDIKGNRPAQPELKILRLNVASWIAQDGIKGAAGVLIRNDSTAQFISGSYFCPILAMEPALLFAHACCEGIKLALSHQPTTIVLESHLFPLLSPLCAAQTPRPEIEQLAALLDLKPPHFEVRSIPEKSNRAARNLAIYGLQMGWSKMIFNDPPEWLVPYLAGCQDK